MAHRKKNILNPQPLQKEPLKPALPPKEAQTEAGNSRSKAPITNQVTLNPVNPIPIDTGSVGFSYFNKEKYIRFLPPYNNYAQMLLEAKNLSVTHASCVRTKANYCAGIGFQDRESDKKLDTRILDWLKSMNLKNQSATRISRMAFDSHFTFGNTPIELVRFKTSAGNRLFVYAHDLQEWRLGEPPADTDICNFAVQSKVFRTTGYHMTQEAYKLSKKLPIYSPYNTEKQNWQKFPDGTERTLIWFKEDTLGYPYYGLPSAVTAMVYQILEYKGARYNLDNFDNNMVVGGVLALQGNLSQGEANRIGKTITDTHTGDGKRGRVIVIASEEGIQGSNYNGFDTTKDGSYIQAKESWRGDIILANEWDAILAGLMNPSTMGKGAGFLTKLIEWKERTVIRPAQENMMDAVWSTVFKIAKDWLGLPFDNYDMTFKNNIDISGLTDVDITPAVSKNEVRLAKGLPKLEKDGDELMNAPKAVAADGKKPTKQKEDK